MANDKAPKKIKVRVETEREKKYKAKSMSKARAIEILVTNGIKLDHAKSLQYWKESYRPNDKVIAASNYLYNTEGYRTEWYKGELSEFLKN